MGGLGEDVDVLLRYLAGDGCRRFFGGGAVGGADAQGRGGTFTGFGHDVDGGAGVGGGDMLSAGEIVVGKCVSGV